MSVSTSGIKSTAASTPQALEIEPEAAPAPAQRPHQRPARRDPLLEAATAGGVLLDSGSFSFKVMASVHLQASWDVLVETEKLLFLNMTKDVQRM